MRTSLIAAALLVLLGAGCGQPENGPGPAGKKRAPAQRVEDAIYVIEGRPVTFDDGTAIVMDAPGSSAATTFNIFGTPVTADLDSDGDADAALTITVDTPGTGTFFYVAAAIKEDWGYRGTEAYPLGDRIAPQTLEVREGLIVANYAERAEGEPMTAPPSVGVSRFYRIVEGQLQEAPQP